MSSKPTVYAVMKVTIEIAVQPSGSAETFDQMFNAAKREAEGKLRNKLHEDFKVIGECEFVRAIVK